MFAQCPLPLLLFLLTASSVTPPALPLLTSLPFSSGPNVGSAFPRDPQRPRQRPTAALLGAGEDGWFQGRPARRLTSCDWRTLARKEPRSLTPSPPRAEGRGPPALCSCGRPQHGAPAASGDGAGRAGRESMPIVGTLARISGLHEIITVAISNRVFFLVLISVLVCFSIKYIGFDLHCLWFSY